MKKTREDRKRFVENCKNKVDRQFIYYTTEDGTFDSKLFVEDVEKKQVYEARKGCPGTFLMRKVMAYYGHKGMNGSAAMMFEKCFPGSVKWISIKAKADDANWKARAKIRRGKKRSRKDGSSHSSSPSLCRARRTVNDINISSLQPITTSSMLSSMHLLVEAAQQQLCQLK
jgi:hypothetical protein